MFKNRAEAAQKLAEVLNDFTWQDPVIIALPRGGVPVGDIVAQILSAPLELEIPRKIAAPGNEEYAVGAISESGMFIVNPYEREVMQADWLDDIIQKEKEEAKRRRELYESGKKKQSLHGKDVIIVDDGIATGLTMRAAIQGVRNEHPKSITIAVPVASADALNTLSGHVDQVICLERPKMFMAVGAHYEEFDQVNDDEVMGIMKKYK